LWKGEEVDPRYKFNNETLINDLQISLDEQRGLSTIISTEEKNRRKREKRASDRRSKGIPERHEYLRSISSEAAERRSEALRMRQSGMPVSLIAKELHLSKKTVYGYFKTVNEDTVTP
jgi:DNA-binding NarL/FixJ family response regulator